MTARTLYRLATVATVLPFAASIAAQQSPRFTLQQPILRIAIDDMPALLDALPGTALGRLFAEADVAAAFALGKANYMAKVSRWLRLADSLLRVSPTDSETLLQRALYQLDWRDFHSGSVSVVAAEDDRRSPVTTVLFEPRAETAGRLAQHLETVRAQLLAALPGEEGLRLAAEQTIDGHDATVVTTAIAGNADRVQSGGFWLLQLPGQFAAGVGNPAHAGNVASVPRPAPGVTLAIDVPGYAALLRGVVVGQRFESAMQATGLDQVGTFTWRLGLAGELLQDELSLELKGQATGLLGALVDGMAPLPNQPLPEGALLQLRCAFDVRALMRATDQLLAQNDLPTLDELGLVADIEKAWTGGVSLAIARPAPGAMIPRLYASFGIVDGQALERLLARLRTHPGLEAKDTTYENQPAVQLKLADLPAGLQPSYCVHDGTIHFAESGLSLRAMLKAAANGAPPALDVGKAPRPAGTGTLLPGFDLRFDGATIHTTIHDVWMPLAVKADEMAAGNAPLVPLTEMADAETVAKHLRRGRGVLRRLPDRIVLAMSGSVGGPELHGLLAAYGPLFSASMTSSWQWQAEWLANEITKLQIGKVHAAIAAFAKRTGKRPASLGELLAAGDLADPLLLLVENDTVAEPVVQDGKQLGRSSFRYYPDGLKVSVHGSEVTAILVAITAHAHSRIAVDTDGKVIEGSGEFAVTKIDALGKQ